MTSDEELFEPTEIDTSFPLPDDMVGEIGRHLPPASMSAWTCASPTIFRGKFFNVEIAQGKQAFKLKQLVVHGKEGTALAMIKTDPSLLFLHVPSVTDLSKDWFGNSRIIAEGSVLQTLLGMGYTQILNDEKVQQAILANAKIALEQLNQQFPEGVDYPFKPHDFDKLVAAIANDDFIKRKPNDNTVAETDRFLEDFKFNVADKGFYFDIRILEEVAQIAYKNRNNKNWKMLLQSCWWSVRVYGYLQTLVTTFDAHVINFGIDNALNGTKLYRVTASLVTQVNASYYPMRPGQVDGMGVDSFMGLFGDIDDSQWMWQCAVDRINKLFQAKVADIVGLKLLLQDKVEAMRCCLTL